MVNARLVDELELDTIAGYVVFAIDSSSDYSPVIRELRHERSRKKQVTWSMKPYCFQ